MIPISEYSKSSGIEESRLIEMIRDGFYSGRLIDGHWYILEQIDQTKPCKTVPGVRNKAYYVFLGLVIGFVFSVGLIVFLGFLIEMNSHPPERGMEGAFVLAYLVAPIVVISICIVSCKKALAYYRYKKFYVENERDL